MLAQYYPNERKILIFPSRNNASRSILEIPSSHRSKFGFPPFQEWKYAEWDDGTHGYEIEFHYEVNQEMEGGE